MTDSIEENINALERDLRELREAQTNVSDSGQATRIALMVTSRLRELDALKGKTNRPTLTLRFPPPRWGSR